MIALWIIGGIVIIITILLNCPVTAYLKYYNESFDIHVKYLFFTVYPIKSKPQKSKKNFKKRKEKIKKSKNIVIHDNSSSVQKDVGKDEKKTTLDKEDNIEEELQKENPKEKSADKKDEILEKISFLKTILESSKKGLRHIVKGIYISDILLDFTVANDDACDAAISYGKINMITYNVISFLRAFFTVSIKKIDITCKFNSPDSIYNGECNVSVRPATLLLAAISIFYHYLINTNKNKKEALKENPQSAN